MANPSKPQPAKNPDYSGEVACTVEIVPPRVDAQEGTFPRFPGRSAR
jgi:hypothetical protein